MSRFTFALSAGIFTALIFVAGSTFTAAAATDADAAKQAKANCKAEVKEHARYYEMSWWAQHKAVQKCIKDALAGH
jgi:hypothetical protein